MRLHTGNKPVPYNTGKVQIGKYYTPPPELPTDNPSDTMNRVQDVLMGWDTGYRRQRRVRQIVLVIVAVVILFLIKE